MSAALHLACAWLAARTSHLRVGVRVSLPASLHPIRLAEEVATLDGLSGGRLLWAAGPDPAHPDGPGSEAAARVFAEQIGIVDEAWTGAPFSHAGDFFEIPELQCMPTPVQKPGPPLCIALPAGPGAAVRAWAEREGRPVWTEASSSPSEAGARASRLVCPVYVGETTSQARATARAAGLEALAENDLPAAAAGGAIVGDAAACADGLQALAERLGLETVVCHIDHAALPAEEIAACQRRLAERVLPRIA